MKSSIKLSIPQSCHESWSNMTPNDKGRFCLNCQKTVTDFTKLSDKEIIELLQNKQASTCGRFLPHQLNRTIDLAASRGKHRKPFMSIAAIAAALTIMIPFAKAAKSPETVLQMTDKENKPVITKGSPNDSAYLISGIVRGDADSTALSYVHVTIKNTNIGTITDSSGKFRLRIPADFKDRVVTIEVGYVGYEKKSIPVVLVSNIKPINIYLHEDTIIMGKWGFQSTNNGEKGLSVWKKFSGTIKNLFS